jgi:hypothetical protein
MYTIGLPAATAAFRAAPWPAVLVIALIVLLAIRTLYNNALLEATQQENSPPSLPSSWGVVRSFYKRRFDLLRDGFVSTGSSFFKINLVGVSIPVIDLYSSIDVYLVAYCTCCIGCSGSQSYSHSAIA